MRRAFFSSRYYFRDLLGGGGGSIGVLRATLRLSGSIGGVYRSHQGYSKCYCPITVLSQGVGTSTPGRSQGCATCSPKRTTGLVNMVPWGFCNWVVLG